jgi:CubicO group peptidase (beta-lactamase class C family)
VADGLTSAGLDRLAAVVADQVGDDRIPGLVVLVARGDQVHVQAEGTLAIGGAPVASDSLFRIASTTKPITAAATLALISEGLIGLDDPVDRLLPELAARRVLRRPDGPLDDTEPATRPITTRDLLTFTFGFASQSWSYCQMVQDSGEFGWDGGLGTHLAGRSSLRPDGDHLDPANVRVAQPPGRARGHHGRRLRRARRAVMTRMAGHH